MSLRAATARNGSDYGKPQCECIAISQCIGFDMHYYEQLFGVFQRLHSAESSGHGLSGWQSCSGYWRDMMAVHGQHSTPGQGATFFFALPVADTGARTPAGVV